MTVEDYYQALNTDLLTDCNPLSGTGFDMPALPLPDRVGLDAMARLHGLMHQVCRLVHTKYHASDPLQRQNAVIELVGLRANLKLIGSGYEQEQTQTPAANGGAVYGSHTVGRLPGKPGPDPAAGEAATGRGITPSGASENPPCPAGAGNPVTLGRTQ